MMSDQSRTVLPAPTGTPDIRRLRRAGHLLITLAAVILFASSVVAHAQQRSEEELWKEINSLAWQNYPAVGVIGNEAQIRLTNDIRFLDAPNTNRFVQLNGNPSINNAYTIATRLLDWFAIFEFDPIGYVRDDEKIDPDELLKTLQEQNVRGIEERKRLGLTVLHLTGWFVAPHYDVETKRLEWGTRLVSDAGGITVNYSIRILGRSGVMRAILVSEPNSLEQDIKAFRTALRGFDFVSGQRYAEFRSGDKMAEYGLAALIVGGAAAAAAKTGAGKALFKFIGIGIFAVGAAFLGFLKRLFSSRKRNQNTSV
jgi:uncharacterized membrane-anchored protein